MTRMMKHGSFSRELWFSVNGKIMVLQERFLLQLHLPRKAMDEMQSFFMLA